MKRILGFIFYVTAVIVVVFVTLLLFLQLLTTVGLLKSSAKEPGLFVASFFFLFGWLLAIFLLRVGQHILSNKNELSLAAKTNLLFIGVVIDVVIFLKSAVPFFTHGHALWMGIIALLSVVAFAVLCWLFTKLKLSPKLN